MSAPSYLAPWTQQIPEEMRRLRRWVAWHAEMRGDRWTKLPRQPSGAAASSTDPATWADLDPVLASCRAGRCTGIGWVLLPPFVGIDVDRCLDGDGRLDPDTAAWVARFESYTERSVSGTGLHIIVRADVPAFGKRHGPREAYNSGRYFTVSGYRWPGTRATIEERPDVLHAFLATLGPDLPARPAPVPIRPLAPALARRFGPRTRGWLESTGPHGGKPSASEADLAACCALVGSGLTAGEALAVFLASPRGQDLLARKGERHGVALAERAVRLAADYVRPAQLGNHRRVRRPPIPTRSTNVRRLEVAACVS